MPNIAQHAQILLIDSNVSAAQTTHPLTYQHFDQHGCQRSKKSEQGSPATGIQPAMELLYGGLNKFLHASTRSLFGAIINCLSGLFLASVIHAFVDWSLLSEELDGLVIDAISVLVAAVILAVSFTTDALASLDTWDGLSEHIALQRKFKYVAYILEVCKILR